MVHILLLILKIIGIILLAVIGIVVLVLGFPVTYKGKGELKQNLGTIRISAGWLFHIAHFSFFSDGKQQHYQLRIFGFPVDLSKKTKSKKEKKIRKSEKENDSEDFIFLVEKQQTEETTDTEQKVPEENIDIERQKSCKKKRKSSVLKKLKKFFTKFIITIKKIIKNIKELYDKGGNIKKTILSDITKEAYGYGKTIVIKLIRHVKPNNIKAYLHFGFESPDITGKTLGYIAMAYAMFGINPKKIQIVPDFGQKVLEGNVRFQGHFFIVVVLVHVLRLYAKKEIRHFINKSGKED